MTVKDRQHLLAVLRYYTGVPDDISGPLTRSAIQNFQRDFGLTVTGTADDATDKAIRHAICYGMPVSEEPSTFWDDIEFFTREEFRCQCNGKYCDGFHVEPDETMVRLCDEIRRRAGVPVLVRDAGGSGLRCPEWNAEIPGAAPNSLHVEGKAADLHPRGKTPKQLYDIAESVMAEMIPGRGGLGLYSWGIHVDVGKYSRWNG